MTARTKLESQLQNVKKRVSAGATKGKKQIVALRAKAADAALHWVMSHEDRVNAFRSSVKGTPVSKAVESLLTLIKHEAHAKAKPAATRKVTAAAKKPAAKKAVRTRKG